MLARSRLGREMFRIALIGSQIDPTRIMCHNARHSCSDSAHHHSERSHQTSAESDPREPSSGTLEPLLRSTLLAEVGFPHFPCYISLVNQSSPLTSFPALSLQEAAVKLFKGQAHALGNRPDAAAYSEQEQELLSKVKQQLSGPGKTHHIRPSALSPITNAGFYALGTAAGLLPSRVSNAILAGVQAALTDQFNEHLREIRAAGLAETQPEIRQTIKELRDRERAPEGAPEVGTNLLFDIIVLL